MDMSILHGKSSTDEWMTPFSAVAVLLPYIKPKSRILCPFDHVTSNYVKAFAEAGHGVTYSHIEDGVDFFSYTKEGVAGYDYIISNPPFSKKDRIFKCLLSWDIPFAMMVGTIGGMFEGPRFAMFQEVSDHLGMIYISPRVKYIRADGTVSKAPTFQSAYICYKFLPKPFVFSRLSEGGVGLF
jgi:hypothetical protein